MLTQLWNKSKSRNHYVYMESLWFLKSHWYYITDLILNSFDYKNGLYNGVSKKYYIKKLDAKIFEDYKEHIRSAEEYCFLLCNKFKDW